LREREGNSRGPRGFGNLTAGKRMEQE
jgi:hypothetical protein